MGNVNYLKIVRFSKKFTILILTVILLSSFVPLQNVVAVSVTVPSSAINLSDFATDNSRTPDIAASGSNVYVVWRDLNDIRFVNSTDSGSTFPTTAFDIGDTTGSSFSGKPQTVVDGSNVYVTWKEGSAIKFIDSNDNGQNFAGAVVDLSSATTTTSNSDQQIAFSSSNSVHVVWRDNLAFQDNKIFFVKSPDNGASFNSIIQIDADSDSTSPDPQIAASGTNVNVVWQDNTDILVARSTDNGNTFPTITDVGDTNSPSLRAIPQIAIDGSGNVYVVWQDNTDIKASINFGAEQTIGSAGGANNIPTQIATSGSNAYVVWQDNSVGSGDIKFASSISAANFGSETNISNNAGLSILPKVAASGSNVFVAWEDRTGDASGDILIKASDDSGTTFSVSAGDNVSNTNGDTSTEPVLAASGSQAYVGWRDNNPGNNDILYKTVTISAIGVSFDATEYKLSDTATITVNDAGASGSIVIDVKSSTTDPTILPITLTETTPGTFSGTITFTETGTSSGTTLLASAGDTITASYSGVDGTASIFSRTIDFSGTVLFNLGSMANVRVDDSNSNLNPSSVETVTVTVTSSANPTGITLILSETGIDTGLFGYNAATESELIFTESSGLVPISTTSSITITQTDGGNSTNTSAAVFDQVTVDVTSTSDSVTGISLVLNETAADSTVYSGELNISTTASDDPSDTILVAAGDFITVTNQAGTPQDSLLLVTPADADIGALQVTTPGDSNIVASYKDASITVSLADAFAPGGGGGGLVRPGLVVNVLAGASAAGGGGGGLPGPTMVLGALALSNSGSEIISMPQEIRDFINDDFDPHTPLEPITDIYEDFELPLSINGNGFALGGYENTLVPQTVKPGEPTEFKIVFYTTSEIAHTSLNFNLGLMRTIAGSDTQVLLYKDKFEIVDPNGNIATATGSINNEGDLKRVATFSITFSDDIQWSNSDFVIRSWNDNLNSGDIIVYDAIQVLPSEEEIAFEESLPEPEVEQLKSQYVPIWIKNNAAWWSQQLIDDSDFVAGIEYLIQNEIITIQDDQVIASSYSSNEIPEWIKNNAGWWSEDLITEKEFIDGLQWLISNGIIEVTET